MNDLLIIKMVCGTVLYAILAMVWAGYHALMIRQMSSPPNDWFLRAFMGGIIAFLVYFSTQAYQVVAFIGYLVVLAGVFWIVFDLVLNDDRGLPLSYVSTTNNKIVDSMFKGRFFRQLLAKIAVIAIGVILITVILSGCRVYNPGPPRYIPQNDILFEKRK
jgi:hypothetical protein